jgi:predicted alpha/beta-fold hydrolase
MSELKITAYNVKTKEKGVEMLNAVIKKTAKGAYMAQGTSAGGDKLTTLMNEEKALALIKAGIAKQGW